MITLAGFRTPADVESNAAPTPTYFFVKSDYKTVKVVFDEILFIEALQKYIRIHTATERVVTLLDAEALDAAPMLVPGESVTSD